MKPLTYLVLATLSNMIGVWANGCGLESDAGAVE